MKHHTHIYIAKKAIEMLIDSRENLKYKSGRSASSERKEEWLHAAKDLRRIMNSHMDSITEASWAPDDILNDRSTFHTFKLYTEEEFTDFEAFAKETHEKDGEKFYRAKGGGGLPYKVDHLARMINDMFKLRKFNDSFNMRNIMYQMFLISHYIVDAHVPMHCDIRDDKPKGAKPYKDKPSDGEYYKKKHHGDIETIWEKAVLPVGVGEKILVPEKGKEAGKSAKYSEAVKYNFKKDAGELVTTRLEFGDIMDYMIDLCIESKKRSLRLFPVDHNDKPVMDDFGEFTREIFSHAIGNVASIWMCIWAKN
ncbi:MAG: hypothetical protein KAV42_02245 [Candidatus Krumholzibacteria bacterium]|nr:hypothetical protein [Candidatus Krumholzibacteria bacterium]